MHEADRALIAHKLSRGGLRRWASRARFALVGLVELGQGSLLLLFVAALRRVHLRFNGARHVARAVGKVAWSLGYRG